MHKGGYIYTLILGIVLSISTLLLFIYNERQREELVPLHTPIQSIKEAWYLSGSNGKEQYLYPLKQVFYVDRYEVKDTDRLQQVLQTKKDLSSRPADHEAVSDLYIHFHNGKETALKVIVKEERFFLMDQKTGLYYVLQAQEARDYFHLLNEKSKMSWLLFIVYTILFFGLVYMLVKKLIAAKSTEKESIPSNTREKRSLADSIYPAILPLVITFSMQIYGAQHSLLLLSAMMLTSGIREFLEKRGHFLKMLLLLPLFWCYLYGFQMITSYFN
ncbi:hypothetical protein AAHH17_13825 [Lysinibacillus capsici]|uniref:hypothetical protein n=1 Tax=Lysinibacillus capsici TaxID=2115968 RepID=UPI0032E4644C